jgi:hypothetical protein
MKIIVVSLVICFLFAFATAGRPSTQSSSNINLDVFSGSSKWWLAIAVRNAGVDTRSVQIKESGSSSWQSMDFQSGWGYYTLSSRDGFKFPVSVLLTPANGNQIIVENKISSGSVGIVNTGAKYSGTSSSTTPASAATTRPSAPTEPASAPTAAPTVKSPTKATTSQTSSPTTKATTKATSQPSRAPTAKATTKPSSAPTTRVTTAPTAKAATTAPSGGCSGPIKVMVPLYTYPGSTWDTVAASGRVVPTVAIINPNSGPGNGPDSSYNTYMTKLHNAGVEMVGYVHTSWGARDINTVKREIDIYASQFPYVVGIFLDEAAVDSAQLPYYQQLYTYIMSMPGWKYDILNPGAAPAQGYLNAATQIVSFEDSVSKFASSSNPSFASCNNKDKFAVIAYGASSVSSMQSAVNTAKSKGYYGWVYITSPTDVCCIYNTLPSYYASMASYIASVN